MATLNTDLITPEQAQAGVLHSADLAEQKTVEEVVGAVNKAGANETALNELGPRVTANEDFNTAQAEINTNVEGRLSSVESFEDSQTTKNSELDAADNGLSLRADNLELFQAQQGAKNTELESADSALESRASSLESFKSAQQATNTALSNADAELSVRAGSLEAFKSQQLNTNINVNSSISALEAKDAEQDGRLDSLDQKTPVFFASNESDAVQLASTDVATVGSSIGIANGNMFEVKDSSPDARPSEYQGVIYHVDTGSIYLESSLEELTPKQFNMLCDGSDETALFSLALNSGRFITQYSGNIGVDSLQIDNECHFEQKNGAKITLLTPSSEFSTALVVNAGGSSFEFNGLVDAGNSSRTIVHVPANDCIVRMSNAINVNADVDSGETISALRVNGASFVGGVNGNDFSNTGNGNESVPRLISIDGGADDYNIEYATGSNLQVGVVVGANALVGHIDNLHVENCEDNGLYNFSNGLTLGDVYYKGNEEGMVNVGSIRSCRNYTVFGNGTSAISVGEAQYMNISNLTILPDPDATDAEKSVNSIVALRGGVTNGGDVIIGNISCDIWGIQLFGIDSGSGVLSSLEIGGGNITYHYYNASTNLSRWVNMTGLSKYNIRNLNIKFIDETDSLLFDDRPQFVLPSSVLEKSFIDNVDIYATLSDGVTKSPVEMRIANFAVNNVHHKGLRMQTNIGPYGREVDYAPPNSVNSGAGVGDRGYWNEDEDYALSTRAAAPFRVRVTVGGDPATTQTY